MLSEISEARNWASERIKASRFKFELSALRSFFLKPYWTRLWIVQELMSCKRTSLRIGLRSLDFIILTLIVDTMLNTDYWAPIRQDVTNSLFTRGGIFIKIGMSNMEYMKPLSLQLHDLPWMFRSQSCLDPRDKIYGLIRIAFSDSGLYLPADYSITAKEVYEATTKHILNNNGYLDLIYNEGRYTCHDIHNKHLLSGLPSRVTD
jgi:hypothetical protein